jgi:hypothetical protein
MREYWSKFIIFIIMDIALSEIFLSQFVTKYYLFNYDPESL